MSSLYVRGQITSFIGTNLATEKVIDLSGHYEDIRDILTAAGLTDSSNWLGLQFIGTEERAINVGADNSKGCYREFGSIYLHVVEPARLGVANAILTRATTIINAFRGQRINDMIITGLTPPNLEAGSTIDFEAGFSSASIIVDYYRDLNL